MPPRRRARSQTPAPDPSTPPSYPFYEYVVAKDSGNRYQVFLYKNTFDGVGYFSGLIDVGLSRYRTLWGAKREGERMVKWWTKHSLAL